MLNLFQLLDNVDVNDGCGGLLNVVKFVKLGVFPIIQIGIPIILIVMGSIDLGKAVLSSDDKEIKAAQSRLLKRVIAAVAVFFVVTIVSLVMGLFGKAGISGTESGTNTTDWWTCWSNV